MERAGLVCTPARPCAADRCTAERRQECQRLDLQRPARRSPLRAQSAALLQRRAAVTATGGQICGFTTSDTSQRRSGSVWGRPQSFSACSSTAASPAMRGRTSGPEGSGKLELRGTVVSVRRDSSRYEPEQYCLRRGRMTAGQRCRKVAGRLLIKLRCLSGHSCRSTEVLARR